MPGHRPDGRAADELRPITIARHWSLHAEGSVLVEYGNTKVLCTASVTEGVPRWRKGSGLGWVTCEYAMLPRSTNTRSDRESVKGRIGGRTHEISRLIGRSLRASIDLKALGENSVVVDCDVLRADGGTRTASITGAFCALYMAVKRMKDVRMIAELPVRQYLAAVSCGIVDGTAVLDLDYGEDFQASTDMNCVMTEDGRLVELQATAEGAPYSRSELDSMLALASKGINELIVAQKRTLATLA
jgi:ribonuclease PH